MNTNVDVNELIRIPAICVAMSLRISSTQNRPTQYAGDVQREQPAVTDPEPAIDPDQDDENQQVPEQFVQERRVDDLDSCPVDTPLSESSAPCGVAAVEDLQAPRHRGRRGRRAPG